MSAGSPGPIHAAFLHAHNADLQSGNFTHKVLSAPAEILHQPHRTVSSACKGFNRPHSAQESENMKLKVPKNLQSGQTPAPLAPLSCTLHVESYSERHADRNYAHVMPLSYKQDTPLLLSPHVVHLEMGWPTRFSIAHAASDLIKACKLPSMSCAPQLGACSS